jgi:predicted metalloprotease with PDZ domain
LPHLPPFSRRRFLFRLLFCLFAAAVPASVPAARADVPTPPARVVYTVTPSDIPNKTYRITVRAEGVAGPAVSFAIPAWTPGWYFLTTFHKNIANVSATGPDGTSLPVKPLDKLTWRVETGGAKNVTLAYDVKATDRNHGFYGVYLDERHGFVAGPAALMYVVNGKTAPCVITYRVPENWKVASANTPVPGGDGAAEPRTFSAPDYDTLADQPADLGAFERIDRTINGVPFSIVLVNAQGLDAKRFTDEVFKISAAGMRVFGGAPFPRYLYHFRFSARGGGGAGLEHLNSTVITLGREVLQGAATPSWALALTAHEFVHAWNVKRIRPEALGPFDYTKEVRVKDLWLAEGVTEYYAPRLLVEAGLRGKTFWLEYLTGNINELQSNPARKRVTLEEASLKAWEGRSEGFGGLSYYNKGMLVGMLLDIEMRHRTANRVGLDDLLKALLRETERTGRGFPEGAIERTAGALTGTDFAPFFQRALRTTEELPFAETLRHAGLRWEENTFEVPAMGLQWDFSAGNAAGIPISAVEPGSAAAKAGLRAGDRVTAVDGKSLEAFFRGGLLQNRKPGDRIVLTVGRGRARPQTVPVILGARTERTYRVREAADATPLQKAILERISGGAAAAATAGAAGGDA